MNKFNYLLDYFNCKLFSKINHTRLNISYTEKYCDNKKKKAILCVSKNILSRSFCRRGISR